MTPENLPPVAARKAGKRRGVVIVAVLLVVTILTYAGYSYCDLMLSEYRASENAHRNLQAKAFADSGIHYAAAVLSNSDNFTSVLNGNPWNNPQAFQDILVQGDNGVQGRFSIIAPADPDDSSASPSTPRYGVVDESGKINPNAIMATDTTGGQVLYGMLMQLPNMTEDIAASIVCWHGGSYGASNGGAQNDYYQGQTPSYQCKGGPIDSIDEYLLVRGVTWDLLYGGDVNRNGIQDGSESNTSSSATTGFDRGWSAYLTVHSREQNYDNNGNMFINLNNTDFSQLYQSLSQEVDDDLAKFIVMYRQNGASNSKGNSQSTLGTIAALLSMQPSQSTTGTTQGVLSSYQLDLTTSGKNTQIQSMWDLVTANVSVTTKVNGKSTTTVYASPLSDPTKVNDLLPKLFQYATLYQGNEIPSRINVNTASSTVLMALTNAPNVSLVQTDVDNIIATRPTMTTTGQANPTFQTLAWLYTEAQLSLSTLKSIEPYVTARSQVYRVQSVGYFDGGKGPTIRLEAVIDTNMGRPRILAWRNLSELGKGWNNGSSGAGSSGNNMNK